MCGFPFLIVYSSKASKSDCDHRPAVIHGIDRTVKMLKILRQVSDEIVGKS